MLSCLSLLVQSRQKTLQLLLQSLEAEKGSGNGARNPSGTFSSALLCTQSPGVPTGVLRGGAVVLAAGIKYFWFTQGLQLLWYYCMCFWRYLLQASCVCSWSQCLTAFIASTLPAEQRVSQYLYFCSLSSLLKAFFVCQYPSPVSVWK